MARQELLSDLKMIADVIDRQTDGERKTVRVMNKQQQMEQQLILSHDLDLDFHWGLGHYLPLL